jgi:hypothetical protein
LVAVPDGEVLTVTSRSNADMPRLLTARVYDVRALGEWCEDEELREALTTLIAAESWDEVGGPGSLRTFRNLLVIHQTDANHRRIRQFLQTLETQCAAAQASQHDRVLLVGELPTAEIQATLARIVNLDVAEVAVGDALHELARENGLRLEFDNRNLNRAGIDLKQPVTLAARGIPLASALRLVLEEHDLAWNFRRESYVVTSDDEREQSMPVVAYRIDDLIAKPSDREVLQDAITRIVHPESWDEVGGPAVIKPLASWLLVGHTLEAHEKIERLLAELRSGIRQGGPQNQALAANRPAENPILVAALERPVDVVLVETPLNEAIAEYSRQAQVSIVISAKRLEEAGVALNIPVTLRTPAAPLADQLGLLLDAKELAFDLRNDLVEVTTPESLDRENRMPIRVYDIRPLVDPASGARLAVSPHDLVTSLIESESWSETGGPAAAVEYRGFLIVRNTRNVQQRVAQLLTALEQHVIGEKASAAAAERGIDIDSAREPLERLLERPIDVAIAGQPLAQVLEDLSTRHGFPLVYSRWREETLIDHVHPISYVATGQPLGAVLDNLLTRARAAYAIRHRAIVVSDVDSSTLPTIVRLYRADDLQQRSGLLTEFIERLKAATRETHPGAAGGWIDDGGGAMLQELGNGWFAVAAPLHMHYRVADYLTEQRTGKVPDREMRWRALAPGRAIPRQAVPVRPVDPANDPFAPPLESNPDE